MTAIARPRRRLRALAGATLAAAAVISSVAASQATAVRTGKAVDPAAWPFIVALQRPGQNDFEDQFCAGTLVAPDRVLTAAHCVIGDEGQVVAPRTIQVRVGGEPLARSRTLRLQVAAIRVHPGYEPDGRRGWDAAVLVLKTRAANAPIRVALPSDAAAEAPGKPALVAGWGDLTDGNRRFPTTLRGAAVPIVAPARCGKLLGPMFNRASDLCAGIMRPGGPDTCKGDSGGPLIVAATTGEPILAGITSGGYGCGRTHSPGVYTKVSRLTEWLAEQGVPVAPAPEPVPVPTPTA